MSQQRGEIVFHVVIFILLFVWSYNCHLIQLHLYNWDLLLKEEIRMSNNDRQIAKISCHFDLQ